VNIKKQQKAQFEKRNSCQRLHLICPIICSPSVQCGSKKRLLSHVCGICDAEGRLIYCMRLKYFPYVAWRNSVAHIMQINIILFPHGATASSGPRFPHYWDFTIKLKRHHCHLDSSGRVISPTQRPVPTKSNTHKRQTSMPSAGFLTTMPASDQPLTQALERAGHWYQQ